MIFPKIEPVENFRDIRLGDMVQIRNFANTTRGLCGIVNEIKQFPYRISIKREDKILGSGKDGGWVVSEIYYKRHKLKITRICEENKPEPNKTENKKEKNKRNVWF